MGKGNYYAWVIGEIDEALGSRRATSRQLGLHHSALKHRIENPHVIKNEHMYAAEYLLERLRR